jgi:parvulin-like peptidyl-prolyl cis-trans isomerase-like protein
MRLFKEPLFHFLLLGAAIFGAHRLVAGGRATAPDEIVVTRGRIDALTAAFTRTWQRPPTASERDGLIRDYIREEVYAREAIALGLDKDDVVIRRRLRQKLEFVSEDVLAPPAPTHDQLRAYLTSHPDGFRDEAQFTFRHIFLNGERHGEALARDAARLLAQLRQPGTDPDTLGDPFLLDRRFEALPAGRVAEQFGEQFAAALAELPTGQWLGPVTSAYGTHLVFLGRRTDGHLPALEEVSDAVRREWVNAQRAESSERFYQDLLKSYSVMVEGVQMARATR